MALNFSHRPIFSSHISEENLVSPLRIANGYLVDGITNRCHEKDDCFDYGRRERGGERSVPPESCSKDVVDLLPSDPFGMDISTTFTAITGWLEDLEADCRGGYEFVNRGNSMGEYDLFAGFNFFWNSAVQFQAFSSNFHFGEKSGVTTETKVERKAVTKSASCGAEGGEPHEALAFSLSFLGIRDLLSVEMVCKSLHSTVQGDPLLWRKIHIDQPLNDKISDDVLSRLATRAQGSLQSLSLVDCPRITDDSLREILESNPRLTKLSVPGCTRISIEGIVNNLKLFNSKNTPGIKHLRIGGLYGITEDHFEELKLLLGVDVHFQKKEGKPLFYHKGNLYLPCDDNRAIDIETCLKCQKLRLVYDCSSEGCRKKRDTLEACRACRLCIPRCVQCGCCIDDTEYEETFCLDWLCSDCSRQLVCSDGQDGNDDGGFEIGVIYEQAYCLYRKNKLDEALELLKYQDGNSAAMLLQSQILFRSGKMDASLDIYKKLQKEKIKDLEINLVAGMVSAGKGDGVQRALDSLGVKANSNYELAYTTACSFIQIEKYLDAEELLLSARRAAFISSTEMVKSFFWGMILLTMTWSLSWFLLRSSWHMFNSYWDTAYTEIIERNLGDETSLAVSTNNLVSAKGPKDISDGLRKLDRSVEK